MLACLLRRVLGSDRLEVRAPGDGKNPPLFFVLQQLVAALPNVIVQARGRPASCALAWACFCGTAHLSVSGLRATLGMRYSGRVLGGGCC